jgi:hypothetical protein
VPSRVIRTIRRRRTLDTKNAFVTGSYPTPSAMNPFSGIVNARAAPEETRSFRSAVIFATTRR